MEGLVGGWVGGWMGGWIDRRMDGQMDGWGNVLKCPKAYVHHNTFHVSCNSFLQVLTDR